MISARIILHSRAIAATVAKLRAKENPRKAGGYNTRESLLYQGSVRNFLRNRLFADASAVLPEAAYKADKGTGDEDR